MKMSKFMKINKVAPKYVLVSKKDGEKLGEIYFHVSWRKWVFEPETSSFFDAECLKDVIEWLKDIHDGKLVVN